MTLPVELTDARLDALREKRVSIRERFDSVRLDTEVSRSIFDAVDERFDNVETDRNRFESAYSQAPEAEPTRDLYRQYLRSLDTLARQLSILESESRFLELHEHQRSDNRSSVLTRTEEVCAELRDAFGISTAVLPVIDDAYATAPLGGELNSTGKRGSSEVYILTLPRESTLEQYEPILMHELGHALLDDHPKLRNEARSVAGSREDDMNDIDDLEETWEEWFEELFCDVCGVLGYGPAYVRALLRRLTMSAPFHLDTGSDAEHPPDALRFELVCDLARREFPEYLDTLEPDLTAFERHLAAFEGHEPPEYEVYDDDRLFEFVLDRVPKAVGGDLDALLDDIEAGVDPSASPDRQHRLEANRRLLPSYPPQRGG